MNGRVGQQLGNYRLLHLLGQGGQAEVYLGEHIHLGTQAAIKVLHTSITQAEEEHFRLEAQMIARLDHPHIVRVLDFQIQAGTPFLVMSYACGGTLRKQHPIGKRVPLSVIVSSVKQIADALQYAHEKRVVHRDLKPENLLLGSRQELLLSDFGIAVLMQTSDLQRTQQVIGTAAYMAPEQFLGYPSFASDQYALAVIVYEWLCGERPFQGTFAQIARGHLYGTLPSFEQKNLVISPEVERVVRTALAKESHGRFDRVLSFAAALEQAAALHSAPTPSFPSLPVEAGAMVQQTGGVKTGVALKGTVRQMSGVSTEPVSYREKMQRRYPRRSQITGAIHMACVLLVTFSILLWLLTSTVPVLHETFAGIIFFSLFLWIAAYADHRQATEHSLTTKKR